MNKREKIIYTVFLAVMLILLVYILLTQGKVKAAQEIMEKQARIQELEILIDEAKESYAVAEDSKNECITSRNEQKDKAHKDAEQYRAEIQELQGFLLGR